MCIQIAWRSSLVIQTNPKKQEKKKKSSKQPNLTPNITEKKKKKKKRKKWKNLHPRCSNPQLGEISKIQDCSLRWGGSEFHQKHPKSPNLPRKDKPPKWLTLENQWVLLSGKTELCREWRICLKGSCTNSLTLGPSTKHQFENHLDYSERRPTN